MDTLVQLTRIELTLIISFGAGIWVSLVVISTALWRIMILLERQAREKK